MDSAKPYTGSVDSHFGNRAEPCVTIIEYLFKKDKYYFEVFSDCFSEENKGY